MPTFTTDWFSYCEPFWREHVVPQLAGVQGANWLEVGTYEGRSALWTLDHVLTGPRSTLTCVDTWGDEDVEETFDTNVAGRLNLVKMKCSSWEALRMLPKNHFNGAYVDGAHNYQGVRSDAELLLPLLRPNAIVVFDDYEDDVPASERRFEVKAAVNDFLTKLGPRATVLHRGYQIIVIVK